MEPIKPHAIPITPANVTDRQGAEAMMLNEKANLSAVENFLVDGGYIPITPQDAIFNEPLAAHLKRSSIGKARNTTSIHSLFLNQNVLTACNLLVKFSHLEVQWV